MSNVTYPSVDLRKTGENIKFLRKQKGISVKQMQDIFGFTTPQAIYKWQWGETLPDIENLLLMSKIFDVSIEKILIVND